MDLLETKEYNMPKLIQELHPMETEKVTNISEQTHHLLGFEKLSNHC